MSVVDGGGGVPRFGQFPLTDHAAARDVGQRLFRQQVRLLLRGDPVGRNAADAGLCADPHGVVFGLIRQKAQDLVVVQLPLGGKEHDPVGFPVGFFRVPRQAVRRAKPQGVRRFGKAGVILFAGGQRLRDLRQVRQTFRRLKKSGGDPGVCGLKKPYASAKGGINANGVQGFSSSVLLIGFV